MRKCSKLCDSMKVEKYHFGGYGVPHVHQLCFRSHPVFLVPEVGGMAVQLVVTVNSKTLDCWKGSEWKDEGVWDVNVKSHLWNVMKREQPVSVRCVLVHKSRVTLHRCYVPNHCLSAPMCASSGRSFTLPFLNAACLYTWLSEQITNRKGLKEPLWCSQAGALSRPGL